VSTSAPAAIGFIQSLRTLAVLTRDRKIPSAFFWSLSNRKPTRKRHRTVQGDFDLVLILLLGIQSADMKTAGRGREGDA
jgi:hypothetical protein